MTSRRINRSTIRRRGAFALPAVLLFLAAAFAMWAIVYRNSGGSLRIEEARTHRDVRATWVAPATAAGLRLLQTGTPPTDTYSCKLPLTVEGDTRYYLLTYDKVSPTRWSLSVSKTDASDAAPDAPTSFTPVPDAPSGQTASAGSPSSISVSWTDVTGETGYKIERSSDGTSGWTQVGSAAANATSFSDTGLTESTTYYYRVVAYNSTGSSGASGVTSATTPQGPPSAPSGFTAQAISNSQISLSWSDVASETGYLVQRSPDDSSNWTQVALTAPNVTSVSDSGLSSLTTYYYRVRAFNLSGNSSFVTTDGTTLPDPPAAPTGLIATAANSSQIDLAWTDNASNESGFKVERSTDNATWTQIATRGPNVTSYTNTGLAATTLYYYRLRAYNAGGDSASATANTSTTDVPAVPGSLVATVVSPTSVQLTWTDNSNNETGFRVQRSPNGTGWNSVTVTAANVTTYTVTGLTTGQAYSFRVRAETATTSSAYVTITATPQ